MKRTWLNAIRAVLVVAFALTNVVVTGGCSSHTMEHIPGDAPTSTPIAAITHNALFVVNGADASISVINTDTNEVAGTIALEHASFPHHIYLSADRSKLLV